MMTMTTVPAGTSLFGLSYESVGEVNQRFMQSQLGGAYSGLLGGLGALLGGLGGPAGLAGGAPPQQQRWERDPSAAAQQVRRVYGHKQKLAAWLAGPAAEGGEALLDGIAALCQDQVSSAPNWPPAKAAPALRTLLDHSTAQRALAAADEGEGGGPITDALVACAWAGRGDLLDLLLSAGVRITVHTLAAAFPLRLGPAAFPGHFAPKLVAPERCDPLRAVRLLLARGRPPVPACPVPHWHPMLRLVGDFKAERGEFGILVSESPSASEGQLTRTFFNEELRRFEKAALLYLQIAEALVEAGYGWPDVLPSAMLRGVQVANHHPLHEPGLRAFLEGDARWLYRSVVQHPWSPASNQATWPPHFRAAVRTVLLAAHPRRQDSGDTAGSAEASEGVAASTAPVRPPPSLSALPPGGVLAVLAAAAYPLSAWRPRAVASADRLYGAFCGRNLDEIGVELASFLPGPGGSMMRFGGM